MRDLVGKCGCGNVEFKVSGFPRRLVNCHCNLCRSFSAAAFSSYLLIKKDEFSIVKGEADISEYGFSDDAVKRFCKTCGTDLYNEHEKIPPFYMVYLGVLSNYNAQNIIFDQIAKVNVHMASKLDWIDGLNQLESHQHNFEKK